MPLTVARERGGLELDRPLGAQLTRLIHPPLARPLNIWLPISDDPRVDRLFATIAARYRLIFYRHPDGRHLARLSPQ
jgi:hypothetical protein